MRNEPEATQHTTTEACNLLYTGLGAYKDYCNLKFVMYIHVGVVRLSCTGYGGERHNERVIGIGWVLHTGKCY